MIFDEILDEFILIFDKFTKIGYFSALIGVVKEISLWRTLDFTKFSLQFPARFEFVAKKGVIMIDSADDIRSFLRLLAIGVLFFRSL